MPCYDWSLESKEGKKSIRSTVSIRFRFWSKRKLALAGCYGLKQMPKGIPNGETCWSLSKYKDGKYLLHFPKAKLENGCWNKQIPDKYLKKENGEIIGYEKLGGVYQEKARSMVEGRCLWGKGIINWKCSFRG